MEHVHTGAEQPVQKYTDYSTNVLILQGVYENSNNSHIRNESEEYLTVENHSVEKEDWDMLIQPQRGWWDLHRGELRQ